MTGTASVEPGMCTCTSPGCSDWAAKQAATDANRRTDGLCPCDSPACSDRALKDQLATAVQP
jgi:hypothetical protein